MANPQFHKITHISIGRPDDEDTPRTNALMAEARDINLKIHLEYRKPSPDLKEIERLSEAEYQKIREAERMEPKERAGTLDDGGKMSRKKMIEWLGQHPFCTGKDFEKATGWSDGWLGTDKGKAALQGIRGITERIGRQPSSGRSKAQAEKRLI